MFPFTNFILHTCTRSSVPIYFYIVFIIRIHISLDSLYRRWFVSKELLLFKKYGLIWESENNIKASQKRKTTRERKQKIEKKCSVRWTMQTSNKKEISKNKQAAEKQWNPSEYTLNILAEIDDWPRNLYSSDECRCFYVCYLI